MAELRARFWEHYSLSELTPAEWEALCDGCGKCCLHKVEDEDTGTVYETNVACHLLDLHTGRCRDYAHRKALVPDCLQLKPELVKKFTWLPETCAYRRVAAGKPLPDWHYLVCGDREAVHKAGASVRGWAVSEADIADDIEDHILHVAAEPTKGRAMTDNELIEQTLTALDGKEDAYRVEVFNRLFADYPEAQEAFLGFDGSSVRMSNEVLELLHGLASGADWVETQTTDVIDLHQSYGDFRLDQFHHFADLAAATVCDITGASAEQRAAWQRQADKLKPLIAQSRTDWD